MNRQLELQTVPNPTPRTRYAKGAIASSFAIVLMAFAGNAQAGNEFEDGFELELGRLAANHVVAMSHLILGVHPEPVVVAVNHGRHAPRHYKRGHRAHSRRGHRIAHRKHERRDARMHRRDHRKHNRGHKFDRHERRRVHKKSERRHGRKHDHRKQGRKGRDSDRRDGRDSERDHRGDSDRNDRRGDRTRS